MGERLSKQTPEVEKTPDAEEAVQTKQRAYAEAEAAHKAAYDSRLRKMVKSYGSATMDDAFVKMSASNRIAQRLTRFKYEEAPFFVNMAGPSFGPDFKDARIKKPFRGEAGIPRFHKRMMPRTEMSYEELLRRSSVRMEA